MSDLNAKMHQIRFPPAKLTPLPQTPYLRGLLLRGDKGRGRKGTAEGQGPSKYFGTASPMQSMQYFLQTETVNRFNKQN